MKELEEKIAGLDGKVTLLRGQRSEMDTAFKDQAAAAGELFAALISKVAPVLPALCNRLVDDLHNPNEHMALPAQEKDRPSVYGLEIAGRRGRVLFLLSTGAFTITDADGRFYKTAGGVPVESPLEEVFAFGFTIGQVVEAIDRALEAQINGRTWTRIEEAKKTAKTFRALRDLIS